MLVIDETYDNGVAQVRSWRHDKTASSLKAPRRDLGGICNQPSRPSCAFLANLFEASGAGSGGGGARFWTIVADQPAVVALKVELERSWEPTPIKTFNVTIDAKDR